MQGETAPGVSSDKGNASGKQTGRSQSDGDQGESGQVQSSGQPNQGRKSSRRRKRGGRGHDAVRAPNMAAQRSEAHSSAVPVHGNKATGQPSGVNKADGAKKDGSGSKAASAVPRPAPKSQTRPQPSTHVRAHLASGGEPYAALDLGTNNCRLLVAEPYGQSFRVVDAFSRIVRLGEGLSQSGRLSEDAQDRAIAALKVCQSKLNYRSVKRFRLIATEACRRATNGGAFLNRVHRETGLRLEIVDRETEARLAVSGCASLVHPEADGVVLFDIGGGSSEIVWLDLDPLSEEGTVHPGEKRNRQTRRAMRHLSERIRCWASLQVGVVTLSEKHGGKVVTRAHFETMVEEVRGMLGDFEERDALAKAIETKHIHMLGTSGTVTTLAGVHLGLERYDRRQVDGTWLTATELRDMIGRVLDMNFQERMNNPCIGADRADLVLAGCAILEAFHREWPCSQLRVADRGLREGILMEMMIDDGVWNPQSNQASKKTSGKKKRSRRRGGRGHRGGHGRAKAT
ncbi:Ppx/GppA phosphatase family protein [Cohaesibacter marisflavi]